MNFVNSKAKIEINEDPLNENMRNKKIECHLFYCSSGACKVRKKMMIKICLTSIIGLKLIK